jgi:hypothetical protein
MIEYVRLVEKDMATTILNFVPREMKVSHIERHLYTVGMTGPRGIKR